MSAADAHDGMASSPLSRRLALVLAGLYDEQGPGLVTGHRIHRVQRFAPNRCLWTATNAACTPIHAILDRMPASDNLWHCMPPHSEIPREAERGDAAGNRTRPSTHIQAGTGTVLCQDDLYDPGHAAVYRGPRCVGYTTAPEVLGIPRNLR